MHVAGLHQCGAGCGGERGSALSHRKAAPWPLTDPPESTQVPGTSVREDRPTAQPRGSPRGPPAPLEQSPRDKEALW